LKQDTWREIFERRGGVIGGDLKCVRGHWTLDGEPVETGDAGLKICIVWPTARHGERQFRDGGGVKHRGMQLYINEAPPDERLELVARFSQIDGYKCLSFMRASGVVKCQLALA
jgi:hypothetical protein